MSRLGLCLSSALVFFICADGFAENFTCDVRDNQQSVNTFDFDTALGKSTIRVEIGMIIIAMTGTFKSLGEGPSNLTDKKSEASKSKKKASHPHLLAEYASGIVLEIEDSKKNTNIFTSYSVDQEFIRFVYNQYTLFCKTPSFMVSGTHKQAKPKSATF